jgi:hypothetical protein
MIINRSVKSEGKGTRTIQYPDEQIEGTTVLERDGRVSVGGGHAFMFAYAPRPPRPPTLGRGYQPVMGDLDDAQDQCVGYRKDRI